MAGYNGYKMSNNAVSAYQAGEKPLSKWTKAAILEEVEESGCQFASKIKKYPAPILKNVLLEKSSWHHTSLMYNRTDFYSLNIQALDDEKELVKSLESQLEIYKDGKEQAKNEPEKIVRRCHYLTWEGSRKHPKAVDHEEVCEIVGNWAMTTNGRKSIKANGFYFVN